MCKTPSSIKGRLSHSAASLVFGLGQWKNASRTHVRSPSVVERILSSKINIKSKKGILNHNPLFLSFYFDLSYALCTKHALKRLVPLNQIYRGRRGIIYCFLADFTIIQFAHESIISFMCTKARTVWWLFRNAKPDPDWGRDCNYGTTERKEQNISCLDFFPLLNEICIRAPWIWVPREFNT